MEKQYRECFKFRAVNKYLIESLVTPSLHFSRQSALNDPFDCQPNLRSALEAAEKRVDGTAKLLINTLMDEDVLPLLTDTLTGVGICSFSSELYKRILWSHYADDHRGLCIRYRFTVTFLEAADTIYGMFPVEYRKELVSGILRTVSKHDVSSRVDFARGVAMLLLTSKSVEWRHERETRLIRHSSGIMKIDPEYIHEIIFGLQTPEADIDLVRSLANAHCPRVKFSRMVRDTRDFGYRREPIQ